MLTERGQNRGADNILSFPELEQYITWQSLNEDVRLLSKAFIGLGISKGEKIAVVMQGCSELITILLATASIGAISVPLNTFSKEHELKAYLADCQPRLLIVANASKEKHIVTVSAILREDVSETGFIPPQIFAFYGKNETGDLPAYEELLKQSNKVTDEQYIAVCQTTFSTDPAFLLYTSGTTGVPKAVIRTTASFVSLKQKSSLAKFAGRLIDGFTIRFKALSMMPMYHVGGLGVIFTLLKGANLHVSLLTHFNPVTAFDVASRQKVDIVIGTPFMLQYMLTGTPKNGANLNSVWGIVFTAAAANGQVLERVTAKLKNLSFFMVSYGSSECGSVSNGSCFIKSERMAVNMLIRLMRRANILSGEISYQHFLNTPYSIGGKIDKSVEVKIINPDTGEFIPSSQPGEIVVKSHRVMRYTDEQLTKSSVLPGGWFRSGDIGFINDSGYVVITDRLKRMISRGGEKISPAEIENMILEHPAITQAYVLGVPDELYGEQVCAAYVTADGNDINVDELRSQLALSLSSFKVPRYLLRLPSFELSSTGKIASGQMKQVVLNQLSDAN